MDKNKIIEGAAKLVAKGSFDKAIKEYQKVLDADPKDVRILQKMGELYVKKNQNIQAATYFSKVAESYATDGFFLKAVALYKQVLKLNPALIEVNIRLAELHQQLQLMGDAMAYYQIVATHHDKAGDTRASLDTLKKMLELDPENVPSRIKLGELYARENMSKEAGVEFKRAAVYYKKHNRTDDYLRVAERISALEPENFQLARELAESYLGKGDPKRALAKLQLCFKADPHDAPTLKLLASAFQELGQHSKTVSVLKELAKVLAGQGNTAEVSDLWKQIEQLDPHDADLAARKAASAPVPARAAPIPTSAAAPLRPSPATASAAPSPAVAAPRAAPAPGKDPLSKLLTETDVYVKYGLHDKALEHLRKIFAVDPENLDAHEKAYQIYLSSGNAEQASEQLLNVLRLCARRADVARGHLYLQTLRADHPGHPELAGFEAVLGTGGGEQDLEEAILVDTNDEEVFVAEAPPDALNVDDVALSSASNDEELLDDPEVLADDEAGLSPEALVDTAPGEQPLDDAYELEVQADADPEADAQQVVVEEETSSPGYEFDLDDSLVEILPVDKTGQDEASTSEPDPALEAAYADAGDGEVLDDEPVLHDPSADVSDEPLLDEPLPIEAEVESELTTSEPEGDEPTYAEAGPDVPAPEEPPEPIEAAPAEAETDSAAEECEEASFFLDQGLLEEAREILETVSIAYPGHPRAEELLGRLAALEAEGVPTSTTGASADEVAPPSVTPLGDGANGEMGHDAFDLAAELAEELGDLDSDPAPPLSSSADDFQYSVDEVFSEFKKGLEKVVKPEDVETHYDLGIAYKEMGLIDDAIGEFAVARKGCLGQKKEIDCLTMTGLLQRVKGDFAAAVEAFRTALASPLVSPETGKALRYELAMAHEAAGHLGRALFQFLRVQEADPKYRDVARNVARLAGQTSPEEDSAETEALAAATGSAALGDPAKNRKVGFV